MAMLSVSDAKFLRLAYEEALAGFDEGGCPIGRQKSYRRMTLYTSLSPCMMCAGTIVQFAIPRVVIGEDRNFAGNADFLRQRGVEVIVADDPDCIALMARFIREKPELWHEDIMEATE